MLTFQFESESESETTFTIPGESESESHLIPFAKCNIPVEPESVESESVESESVGTSCKLHLNLNQLNQKSAESESAEFHCVRDLSKVHETNDGAHVTHIMKVLQKRVVTTCISLFRFMNSWFVVTLYKIVGPSSHI